MAKGTINKAIILGRLGVDPELRYTPSGTAVANLSIATNEGYKDRQTGQFVDSTQWHRVVAFSKAAETLGEYGRKGALIYVEGRLRTNKWQDKQGNDRYTTEIIISEFQFVGGKQENQTANQPMQQSNTQDNQMRSQSAQRHNHNQSNQQQSSDMPSLNQLDDDFEDDEIPF